MGQFGPEPDSLSKTLIADIASNVPFQGRIQELARGGTQGRPSWG